MLTIPPSPPGLPLGVPHRRPHRHPHGRHCGEPRQEVRHYEGGCRGIRYQEPTGGFFVCLINDEIPYNTTLAIIHMS